jgi:hypothetical protein
MSHSETDRQAFHADVAAKDRAQSIAEWLARNPDIGVLNGDRYYRIVDGQQVAVPVLQESIEDSPAYNLVWANLEILAGYQEGDKEAARNWRNAYPDQNFYRFVVSHFHAAVAAHNGV